MYSSCRQSRAGETGQKSIFTTSPEAPTSRSRGQLILDSQGNLYGTTTDGGIAGNSNCGGFVAGCGVVFKLASGGGGAWTESVLYTFNGNPDGGFPESGVEMDSAGNIFGTTNSTPRAAQGQSTTFANGSALHHKNIYAFTNGKDGGRPEGIAVDANDNIFVSTSNGGVKTGNCASFGCGTLAQFFQTYLGSFNGHLIYSFKGRHDGATPIGIQRGRQRKSLRVSRVRWAGQPVQTGISDAESWFSPASGGGSHGKILYSFTGAADGQGPLGRSNL